MPASAEIAEYDGEVSNVNNSFKQLGFKVLTARACSTGSFSTSTNTLALVLLIQLLGAQVNIFGHEHAEVLDSMYSSLNERLFEKRISTGVS